MNKMKPLFLLFIGLWVSSLYANVVPNGLFCDNAVLQRGVAVPVWGIADDGEKVTVTFAGQTVSTVAAQGQWMLKLKPLKAGGPYEMTIQGNNTVKLVNILVGEVWICSGQSNMERQLGLRGGQKPILNWLAEAADANYPEIREFALSHVASTTPLPNVISKWVVCDTGTVKNFSAVGYFFGSTLYKNLKVPIGLIHSSWGGTSAEKWASRDALEANPELKTLVERYDKSIIDYPAALQKYNDNEATILAKWAADTAAARQSSKPLPRKPAAPIDPVKSGDCGGLFNAMINPLIPYAIKGVIWYQGESNVSRSKQYQTLFSTMITDWRSRWAIGNFPFLFVQIAPFRTNTPELREAQLIALQKTPNTAMVVTLDCGDSIDIHPTNKRPVGERLALAARAIAYNEKKLEYSGPVYEGYTKKDGKIEISFTHKGGGLVAKDGDLIGFTISSDGKTFVPAKASIQGDKVVVYSDDVKQPKAARYAFVNNAFGNLFNKEGLPASPFRTDVE
ncbi:sialate O-acetylesterase [Parasediminibacterium sp. JCM 36343]|uniref:sialate O-acetylesterase n=1 Tax=Parasediminibacterium sp. JCM 36343 TaxID=3374279 RepID=UPI00397E84FD